MPKTRRDCPECGATIEFRVHGRNRRDAESYTDWLMGQGRVCDACHAKQRGAENAAAAEANTAAGLPTLTGSEKQVAWAETIRARLIPAVEAEITTAAAEDESCEPDKLALIVAETRRRLRGQTSAHWWIDRRDLRARDLLEQIAEAAIDAYDRGQIAGAPNAPDPEIVAEAEAEATIRPECEQTTTVAEIRAVGDTISIHFPEKREDFRQLVRFGLGYTWSGSAWARKIRTKAAPIDDRIAEAGHRLLAAGFPIRIQDAELRQRAIEGAYQPERKRWIMRLTTGPNAGKLYITWPREDDLYRAAKRLPGARYDKPGIAVPVTSYDAIEDFADAHGFAISDGARAALDQARRAHDDALIVTPAPVHKPEPAPDDSMPPATGEIDPSLRDDDQEAN